MLFDEMQRAPRLSDEIRVVELLPDGRRYVLPRRRLGPFRWLALPLVLIGLAFIGFAVYGLPIAVGKQPGAPGPFQLVALLFSVLPLLGALVPLLLASAILVGRSEIEVNQGQLRTIERAGLFHRTRRAPINDVRRFIIAGAVQSKHPGQTLPAVFLHLAAIRVECGDGRKPWLAAIGYPQELLLPLAYELADQCHVPHEALGHGGIGSERPAPAVSVEVAAPAGEAERLEQPAGSQIVMQEQPGGVTFNVPPQGVWRGSGGLFLFAVIWLVFTSAVCGVIAFALVFAPQPNQGPSPWLIIVGVDGIFTLVGVILLLIALHLGRRRAGIVVAGGQLSVLVVGLFGSSERTWAPGEVAQARIGSSGIKVNNRPLMELQIIDVSGHKFGVFAGRKTEELEWLATQIRRALAPP